MVERAGQGRPIGWGLQVFDDRRLDPCVSNQRPDFELRAAANDYESRAPGLGNDFLTEVEAVCSCRSWPWRIGVDARAGLQRPPAQYCRKSKSHDNQ